MIVNNKFLKNNNNKSKFIVKYLVVYYCCDLTLSQWRRTVDLNAVDSAESRVDRIQ